MIKKAESTSPAERYAADLDVLRVRIAGLKRRRTEVEDAPKPKAEALTAMELWVDEHGAGAARGVGPFVEHGRRSSPELIYPIYTGPRMLVPTTKIEQFICWAFRDQVKAKFAEEIDRYYESNAEGLPADARQVQVEQIEAQLLTTETDEEILVCAAESEGIIIIRRHNADPRALIAASRA